MPDSQYRIDEATQEEYKRLDKKLRTSSSTRNVLNIFGAHNLEVVVAIPTEDFRFQHITPLEDGILGQSIGVGQNDAEFAHYTVLKYGEKRIFRASIETGRTWNNPSV